MLPRFLARWLALEFHDRIAYLQSCAVSFTARSNGRDRHRSIEVTRTDEARIRDGIGHGLDVQAGRAKEIVPGDFIGSSYVLIEKPSEIRMADGLGSLADAVGIVEENALLGIVDVHPLEELRAGTRDHGWSRAWRDRA